MNLLQKWPGTLALVAALALIPPAAGRSPEEDLSLREQGGAHGGGTDANIDSPLDIIELRGIVANLKPYLIPVLLYQERLARETSSEQPLPGNIHFIPIRRHFTKEGKERYIGKRVLLSARSKLFPQPGTKELSAELSRVKFVLRENEPCHDLKFQDKDATAFNEDPDEICLSAMRLLPKLTKMNAMTKLLSVAMHEMAHRMGANESEALLLESLTRFTQRIGSEVEYKRQLETMRSMSRVLQGVGLSAGRLTGKENLFRACMGISRAYIDTRDAVLISRLQIGFSSVTQKQLALLNDSYSKLEALAGSCEKASREEEPSLELDAEMGLVQQNFELVRKAGWGSEI